ncbi:MAG: ribosome maturation factor RimP [Prochlorococcus sp. SP3034]|nr:ribosome maturation factor RimP [Prochlorococcus sp. SP3034]
MDKKDRKELENLLSELAESFNFQLYSLNLLTNSNPITILIKLKKADGNDITIDDCSNFNNPAEKVIDKSKLINCSYVLEISSQGVSDELTSERDFKTFKGFPVNVELNQKHSNLKNLNGLLHEKSKDYLAINIKGKIKKIPFIEVLKVSLATIKY